MATFSQNGIQFTATKGNVLPGKYSNGYNDEFNTAQIDGVEPLINAVEIDRNGANLYGTTGIWPTNTNPTIVWNESSAITLKTIRQ